MSSANRETLNAVPNVYTCSRSILNASFWASKTFSLVLTIELANTDQFYAVMSAGKDGDWTTKQLTFEMNVRTVLAVSFRIAISES